MGVVSVSGRREFRDLVSPQRARSVIDGLDLGGGIDEVALADARGRVLAKRVEADIDVPGFDRAAMDGYAVRARDTFGADEADPVTLQVIGEVHAGARPAVTIESGTAAEISTGAVVPPGADAVVMVERTDPVDGVDGEGGGTDTAVGGDGDDDSGAEAGGRADGDTASHVAIRTSVAPGDHVMAAGADIAAGERGLGPGTRVTAREIGLLAALGHETVPVRGAPTVGIISTGDELVRPGEPIDHDRGQIHDVNSHTIAAAAATAGADPTLYPHVGDDYDAMEAMLQRAASECDLVVSSGSTSASAVDVIHRVIDERGELLLHGVAVKPGKPMLVGRIGGAAYVGLPGYPVSALMIFTRFVAPALRRAAGRSRPATASVEGEMAVRERFDEGRMRLLPAGLVTDGEGTTLVYPVDKGSGATTSLVEADGIVEVGPDTAFLAAGETVTVELFSPDVTPPTILGVCEDDPLWTRLLDRVEGPRYLAVGSIEGGRRLERGIPDVAVLAGPVDPPEDAELLGAWQRRWGIVVPAGNPAGIDSLEALVDGAHRFVNAHGDAGLRGTLDAELESLAAERGMSVGEMCADIDGYDRGRRGHRGPARLVAAGAVDAALGLEAAATAEGLGFVPLGWEAVQTYAQGSRMDKPGVKSLRQVLGADIEEVAASLPGFEP